MGKMTRIDIQLIKSQENQLALGAGFVALDIVEGREQRFAAAGGSCGNVMAILSWLGWNSAPISRLGQDPAHEFIVDEFNSVGVKLDYLLSDSSVSTPIVIQKFVESKDGVRSHRFSLACPDCRGWLPRFRPMTIKQATPLLESNLKPKCFYFDRVTPSALKLAAWAKEQGALIMFEPASVNDERSFQRAVDLCHILKYSDERLGHLKDLEETQHPKVIIKTQGEDGLAMRWRNRWSSLEAFDAPLFEDAAGSGDWCSAGILHTLGGKGVEIFDEMNKSDLERAVRLGQGLAALNCSFEGARGMMEFMDIKTVNKALRSLTKSERNVGWTIDGKEHRVFPEQLCDLCVEPNSKIKKSIEAA